jgi:diguanylate cyclase (GGDEF)-like protein/PAS domain S-box-containing protein
MFNRLQKISPIKLWLISIAIAVALSESIACGMEILLKGSVTYDYLLTGLIASLFVAGLVGGILTSFLKQLRQNEVDLSIAAIAFEAQESLMITDANGVILRVNQEFIKDSGFAAEEIVGQTPSMLQSGRHDAQFFKVMWETIQRTGKWHGEIWDKRKNGEIYPKLLTISVVKGADGVITHYVGSHVDISERKLSDELIWKQANYDKLTGLPNRSMFHERLNTEIAKASRATASIALLFIDLDHFKEINDTLGHDIGDVLLKEAAYRLSACARESDLVSRLGGDEFTIIISDLAETAHIEVFAQKLINQLSAPYYLGKEVAHVSASIGISLYPGDASTLDDLMKAADQAMYAAKAQGRNGYSYFKSSMQESSRTRMQLGNELHHALERKEFVLHYQPQIDLKTGRVSGLEALVRWQHPTRGLVSPEIFIPLAESNGLILPLGDWVMTTACRQLKQWQDLGLNEVTMSINLSARQFRQSTLVANITQLLENTGLAAEYVGFEITESLAMDNPVENIKTLEDLHKIGVVLSIDDFGTGHSSLGYLKDFPITHLKLDRSFIVNIESKPSDAIIVLAAINLAHDLGLSVVAEGVEDKKQVEYLTRLDCDVIQGYYFSKPLPANQAEAFIRSRNAFPDTVLRAVKPLANVLVIDDDEMLCKYLANVFTYAGFVPSLETDPVQGLENVRQEPEKYDLILVDMLMPGMSGIDLIKNIREHCRDTPIVVITAFKFDHVRKALKPIETECRLFYGINYFVLEKPLSADSVLHIANKIFRDSVVLLPASAPT